MNAPLRTMPILLATLVALAPLRSAKAEELHEAIDRLVAAQTPGYADRAAPPAGDGEFLRRVYLDLTGTLPDVETTRAFLADPDPEKRTKVIDGLLQAPEHARHMQRTFDVILLRRLPAKNVSAAAWETFLRESFAENTPWDQMVRDILSNDGTDLENRGPARFYLDRGGEVNEITRDVSRIFLGADIECAQCHDHPEVSDYRQEHYYGLSAFFVRSSLFKDPKLKKKAVLAEKAEGEVAFRSVFTDAKEDSTTLPRLFGGEPVPDPKLEKGKEYEVKPKKNVRPIPVYSRREQLPERLASEENERFCRTSANRFWSLLMKRGIVHPVDMDHSDNPPSHPELLEVLSQEFAAHDFDVRWLLREIALSDTYQRSSVVPAGGEPLPEEAFGQAILDPLSPEQLAWSVLQATGEADVQARAIEAQLKQQEKKAGEPIPPAEREKKHEAQLFDKLKGYESRFVKEFGGEPGKPPEDFESTVEQVLFLANDSLMVNLLKPKNGNLVGRLSAIPPEEHEAIAEELFLSVLVRRPTAADVADVKSYLEGVPATEREDALGELVWALVTSSEFRFVH